MWVITNTDYETGDVSDVYGPFNQEIEAKATAKEMAENEFDDIKGEFEDAQLNDNMAEDGTIEITFDEPNQNGCLYQVLKVQKP